MQFRHLLVRATNWVGDAVMSVPALQALRRYHPDARISILARPWVAGLYGREPFCDELIPYTAPSGMRGIMAQWQAATELRRKHFDGVILLQNAFEAAAVAWMAQIPVRIGYRRDARGPLLTNAIATPKPGEIPVHQRFYYFELLRRAGVIPVDADPPGAIRLEGASEAARAGAQLLSKVGLKPPVIGIAPGAAYGGAKRWLPERFAEAAAAVIRERGHGTVAIFGSKEETEICVQVEKALHTRDVRCITLAGQTSLAELMDATAACELLLSNDSGPMHIASAMGVPTVAVFGATDDLATGPTGPYARVVRHQVECSPCLLRECPIDHRCMTRVDAQLVAAEGLKLTSAAARH